MKLRLEKEFMIRLYCYTMQGERSIAFSLGAPWPELREYYRGARLAALKEFVQCFHERLERHKIKVPTVNRNELGAFFSWLYPYQCLFSYWTSRWRRHWSISAPVVGFMASALDSLVHHLDSEIRPDQEVLISLRMDLCASRSLIQDFYCNGLDEINRARHIEHFWQADWITPVKLEDLLGKSLNSDELTRKSA